MENIPKAKQPDEAAKEAPKDAPRKRNTPLSHLTKLALKQGMEKNSQEKPSDQAAKEVPAKENGEPRKPGTSERGLVLVRPEAQVQEDEKVVRELRDAIEKLDPQAAKEGPKPAKFEGELAEPEPKTPKAAEEAEEPKPVKFEGELGEPEPKKPSAAIEAGAAAVLAGAAVAAAAERPASEVPEKSPPAEPGEKRSERSVSKSAETKKKESSKLGKVAAWLGQAAVYGTAKVIHGGFKMFEKAFTNLYDFGMDPGKFLKEVGGRFAKSMARPPEGKGAFKGFFSSMKWLLMGENEKKMQHVKQE